MRAQQRSCVTPWKRFVFMAAGNIIPGDERRAIQMHRFRSQLFAIRVQESIQPDLKIKISDQWLHSNCVSHREQSEDFFLYGAFFIE